MNNQLAFVREAYIVSCELPSTFASDRNFVSARRAALRTLSLTRNRVISSCGVVLAGAWRMP